MVLQSIRKYVYDRRRTLLSVGAVVGGVYLVGQYALRRLEEARNTLLQDRTSKENLRQRFLRNQEDCVFTSQALVPTLGNQILEELDVEGITLELQQHGSKPKPPQDLNSTTSSLEEKIGPDAASQQIITPVAPAPDTSKAQSDTTTSPPLSDSAPLSESSHSWVEEFSASQNQVAKDHHPPAEPLSQGSPEGSYTGVSDLISTTSEQEGMTDSFYNHSSSEFPSEDANDSLLLQQGHFQRSPTPSPPPRPTKTKAQLWKDLRTATFTRTITLIYALTLLALQTHIQLNILASHKYVQSILEMEEEEKEREIWAGGLGGAMSQLSLSDASGGGSDNGQPAPPQISALTEQKYLTMNWWLLNVGWKDVTERVRAAVTEVFDVVPLKSQLTPSDLKALINSVRHLVEFDGGRNTVLEEDQLSLAEQERLQGVRVDHHLLQEPSRQRTDFLPILLPLSRTAEQHVLLSGGLPPDATFASMLSAQDNHAFRSLMDETKAIIQSKDFEVVLDSALEWGVNLFIEGMEIGVFRTNGEDEATVAPSATGHIEEVEEVTLRLAAILPGVARWSHLAVDGIPNELIEGISRLQEVAAFSAITFASYEKRLKQ
ncbi:peroxin [Tulasnella sp. JGI-2019a]|nr:peroxin [Tulasnella sp. JGI-2019a]KAG8999576.1 peroxin [Tulasnella sp. JGI-2019a]KAG9024020.1 peroxin [Tulasnella sp. JGI-2019a]